MPTGIAAMTDRISKDQRSRVMSAVRSSNTRLEDRFQKLLINAGLKGFRIQARDLPGTPDVVFRRQRVAVFLDSCFWHGCEIHHRPPATNQGYWEPKIAANIRRDKAVAQRLRRQGWSVCRCWEHDLKEPARFIRRLAKRLRHIS